MVRRLMCSASPRHSDVEKTILRKLLTDRFIGRRHTSIDNVPKGFPKHLRGEVKKATRRLIKEGFIIAKPTAYGLQVSLNPRKIAEIEEIV